MPHEKEEEEEEEEKEDFPLYHIFPLDCHCYIINLYMYLLMFVVLSFSLRERLC